MKQDKMRKNEKKCGIQGRVIVKIVNIVEIYIYMFFTK